MMRIYGPACLIALKTRGDGATRPKRLRAYCDIPNRLSTIAEALKQSARAFWLNPMLFVSALARSIIN